MANSRKSKPASGKAGNDAGLPGRTARALAGVPAGSRLVVGLSGGVDSVVLLDLVCRLAKRRRLTIRAIHINHQLQKPASEWASFCRRQCRERGVPLRVVKVAVPRGDSIEGAARRLRYRHFFSQRADAVLLAHHKDDQAETVLLQMLRGAGLRGIAGMPYGPREAGLAEAEGRRAPVILRPLLEADRAEIEAYARARGLEWIEDPSNADTYYQRNYLRQVVMPALAERFPAYRDALSRAARHAAEAMSLLDSLAEMDAGPEAGGAVIDVRLLEVLPPARARNVLRHFLVRHGLAIPSAARLDEALRQVVAGREDGAMAITFGGKVLRRHGGRLVLTAAVTASPTGWSYVWDGRKDLQLSENKGFLSGFERRGEGISVSRLEGGRLTVRPRRGGERLKPAADRPTKTLKNLLQESRIPAWQRDSLPLIFAGDELVAIPGVAIAAGWQAGPGETGIIPRWSTQKPPRRRRPAK